MRGGGRVHGRGGASAPGGCVPCDLSQNAFDVTCMLSPHQLRVNTNAAAFILLGYTPLLYAVNRMTDRQV